MNEYNFSDEELDDIIKSVDHEDDISDLYDDEDFHVIDEETGEEITDLEYIDDIHESVLMEVMSRIERLRAKTRFMKSKTKRSAKMKLALKRPSNAKKLLKKARLLAIKRLKEKMLKKPLAQFSVVEKEKAEKIIAKKGNVIDKLAIKLVPRIREIEKKRLSAQNNK